MQQSLPNIPTIGWALFEAFTEHLIPRQNKSHWYPTLVSRFSTCQDIDFLTVFASIVWKPSPIRWLTMLSITDRRNCGLIRSVSEIFSPPHTGRCTTLQCTCHVGRKSLLHDGSSRGDVPPLKNSMNLSTHPRFVAFHSYQSRSMLRVVASFLCLSAISQPFFSRGIGRHYIGFKKV